MTTPTGRDDAPSEAPKRRSPLRAIALSLLPLLLVLALAEAALWALGLGEPDLRMFSSRGFDPSERYLRPLEDPPGGWETQMFEEDRQEVVVPPRDDRVRVVLLGGSNTRGFPEAYLQQVLDAERPEPGWDVVNLGRPGYGSERVAILAEQSLVLEPDVAVIYAGHNEFMELGFAWELHEMRTSAGLDRLSLLLGHLRLFNVLAGSFAWDETDWREFDARPEARRQRDDRFRSFTYDRTLTFYDAYESNLRRMVRTFREAGVAVVLCTVVPNDMAFPKGRRFDPSLSDDERAAVRKRLARAATGLPAFVSGRLVPPHVLELQPPDWGMAIGPADHEERLSSGGLDREPAPARPLLGALAEAPATSGRAMDSIAGSHTTDPKLWTEDAFAMVGAMARLFDPDLTPQQVQGVEHAMAALDEAETLAPTHPEVHYGKALCALLLGDREEAARRLLLSAEYDCSPRKGTPVSNARVRRVAAEEPGVVLVDAERIFRERTPDGIIGYEIMIDVCHLQPGVRPVLMRDLAAAILELDLPRS